MFRYIMKHYSLINFHICRYMCHMDILGTHIVSAWSSLKNWVRHLFSISILDMCLSPHVVSPHVVTEWNLIKKFMNYVRVLTKDHVRWSRPWATTMVGRPASSLGRLASLCALSPCALSMVRFEPNTLYFHMFHFLFWTKLKITW
jgi:hypothetical protein